MEHPPKPLSQILMSIFITQMLTLMTSHQMMILVSTALGQRRLPIWLSSVFPLHQQKRTIGDELGPFTRSPRLETRVVRWYGQSKLYQCNIVQAVWKSWIRDYTPPHPFNMSWIDSTALEVKQRCLVPVSFNYYKDKIWCDVITMNVGQVILGRLWLFDKKYHYLWSIKHVSIWARG